MCLGRVLFLGNPFFAFGKCCASGQSMNVGSNESVSASQVFVGGDPAVLAPLQDFHGFPADSPLSPSVQVVGSGSSFITPSQVGQAST